MIDKKTREKIINLWRDGESKASIGRKTKVSQPTIRKVIKEVELAREPADEKVKPKSPAPIDLENRVMRLEEVIERHERWWSEIPTSDKFIVNLTHNAPYGVNPPLECLKNGVPYFDLERMLLKILPPLPVSCIMEEIERLGGPGDVLSGNVYEVRISRDKKGIDDITVQPLTF